MISQSAECEEAYAFLAKELQRLSNIVGDFCKNISRVPQVDGETSMHMLGTKEVEKNDPLKDTSLQNAKGFKKKTGCKGVKTGKRHRSWVEKQSKKKNVTANQKRAKHGPTAITPTTTRKNAFNTSQEDGISQHGMAAITPTTRNTNAFSQRDGISQVVQQSYFVGSHNGDGLYVPEYQQSYTDLLWNGVRADGESVDNSQRYPTSN